jgi:hypothetical protein
VAPSACNPCPLVCESGVRRHCRRELGRGTSSMLNLDQTLRNLSQGIGKSGLCGLMMCCPRRRFDEPVRPWRGAVRDRRKGPQPAPSSQDAVNRHKVTMLDRLFGYRPSRFGQEAGIAMRVLDTSCAQFASRSEKTFTRKPHDTLRSHLSCIGARGVPNIDGATHASAG